MDNIFSIIQKIIQLLSVNKMNKIDQAEKILDKALEVTKEICKEERDPVECVHSVINDIYLMIDKVLTRLSDIRLTKEIKIEIGGRKIIELISEHIKDFSKA